MSQLSLLFGTIEGIPRKDYLDLRKELENRFDAVAWNDGVLTIKSNREHGRLRPLFTKLAASIKPDGYGTLLYVGHGNVACFYFGSGRYVGRRYKEPAPPDWWPKPGG